MRYQRTAPLRTEGAVQGPHEDTNACPRHLTVPPPSVVSSWGYEWKCRENGGWKNIKLSREKRMSGNFKNKKRKMVAETLTDLLGDGTCRARGPEQVVRDHSVYGPTYGRIP